MTHVDRWSVLAIMRFGLAGIVATSHLELFVPLGRLNVIPEFGAFEAILAFLLISGYSVGQSFLSRPDGFLRRRAKRIFPVYLAALVLTLVARNDALTPGLAGTLLLNILLLNQLLTTTSFAAQAWSLSLEFWLYTLTHWFARQSGARLRWLCYSSLLCYLAYTVCRTLFHLPYYAEVGYGLNLLFLSFAWILGFSLAKFGASSRTPLTDVAVVFICHWTLQFAIDLGHRVKHHEVADLWAGQWSIPAARAITLMAVWIAFRYVLRQESNGTSGRVLPGTALLGDISYPLYLVHMPVFVLLHRHGVTDVWTYVSTAIGASLSVHLALERSGMLSRVGSFAGPLTRNLASRRLKWKSVRDRVESASAPERG